MENNKNYMKGFVPYAIAAAILSLCGGFTASVPTAISTAWDADSSLTFITLAYSLAAAAMAPILGKLGGVIGRRKMCLDYSQSQMQADRLFSKNYVPFRLYVCKKQVRPHRRPTQFSAHSP